MKNINTTPDVTIKKISEYLKSDKRFDGRKTDEFRDLIIEKDVSNKAEGSVRIKLGKTEVIVGIKADVAEPYPDSPDKGNLMVTAELLPLSSSRFELGPPKFDTIELGRIIDRGIRESGIIDVKKLVIKEGEKVWAIFIDIYSINDDGNLLDAAGIGALAALKLAKLPKYNVKEEEDASETRLTIGISDGIISSMQKGNIFPLKDEEIFEAIDIADKTWKE